MRNLFQTDRLANVGPVFDHGYDPAVVEFQKCAQHHQREKLMLGEVLAAEPAGIGRQGAQQLRRPSWPMPPATASSVEWFPCHIYAVFRHMSQ